MPSPPLDPDVADLAPDDPVLTAYDEQHVVTYLRLLDADADRRTGGKLQELSFTWIPNATRSARAVPSIAIWPAPNG